MTSISHKYFLWLGYAYELVRVWRSRLQSSRSQM